MLAFHRIYSIIINFVNLNVIQYFQTRGATHFVLPSKSTQDYTRLQKSTKSLSTFACLLVAVAHGVRRVHKSTKGTYESTKSTYESTKSIKIHT